MRETRWIWRICKSTDVGNWGLETVAWRTEYGAGDRRWRWTTNEVEAGI